jgi:ribonuclease P protein component
MASPTAPATSAADADQPPRRRERFSAAQRLRRPADFDEARRRGRRVEAGGFTLRLRLRPDGGRRLGIIAPRKAGPAVERNRAKRALRELFRRNQDILPPACDVVVVVRPSFLNYSLAELRERYLRAIEQAARREQSANKPPEAQ